MVHEVTAGGIGTGGEVKSSEGHGWRHRDCERGQV